MIKTITEEVVVPATTETRQKFQCEKCNATFSSHALAQKHIAQEHAYTDRRTLAGYFGDETSIGGLPDDVRGDQVFHIVSEEGFNAIQRRRAFSREAGWCGPGWYVLQVGAYHDHNHDRREWQKLIPLVELEQNLREFVKQAAQRLQSVRRLLGPHCRECGYWGGHHATNCSEFSRPGPPTGPPG